MLFLQASKERYPCRNILAIATISNAGFRGTSDPKSDSRKSQKVLFQLWFQKPFLIPEIFHFPDSYAILMPSK